MLPQLGVSHPVPLCGLEVLNLKLLDRFRGLGSLLYAILKFSPKKRRENFMYLGGFKVCQVYPTLLLWANRNLGEIRNFSLSPSLSLSSLSPMHTSIFIHVHSINV